MASTTTTSPVLQTLSLPRVSNARRATVVVRAASKPAVEVRSAGLAGRRQLALLLTATTTALTVGELPALADGIGLFGLRKKLKSAEQEAEEIVREGFEAAEKGIETAEKGIVAAEKGIVAAERGIETAEREIEEAVSFGALAQAGAVAGAEVVGVLVATAVVNGILGPEGQKS